MAPSPKQQQRMEAKRRKRQRRQFRSALVGLQQAAQRTAELIARATGPLARLGSIIVPDEWPETQQPTPLADLIEVRKLARRYGRSLNEL